MIITHIPGVGEFLLAVISQQLEPPHDARRAPRYQQVRREHQKPLLSPSGMYLSIFHSIVSRFQSRIQFLKFGNVCFIGKRSLMCFQLF